MTHFDVVIVGAGIGGLAHAYAAWKRGLRVLVLERDQRAQGATIRNFGMIWPIGQPAGELYDWALQSRQIWLELAKEAEFLVQECGSYHLAYRDDELAVLEEFCQRKTHRVELHDRAQTLAAVPIARQQDLLAGLWSASELRVDPRRASSSIANWLSHQERVLFRFGTHVASASEGCVTTSDGESIEADRIIVCCGSDLRTLHPNVFQQSGLMLCKLQMLQTRLPVESEVRKTPAVPHVASGLTLRHYTAFQSCQSLQTLVARIERETPELNQWGIHVMASTFPDGRVILGDSHEYGSDIDPFDNPEIEQCIVRELKLLLNLELGSIDERWHGIYSKHPSLPVFESSLPGGVEIFVGLGGAGMTMAFGLAERAWQRWSGNQPSN